MTTITKPAVTSLLPAGVLAHTFSFLGLQEFATSIRQTCKTFKAVDERVFLQCARETQRLMNLGPQLYLFTNFSARSLHTERSRREVVDLMTGLRTFDILCATRNREGHLKNEQEFETALNGVLESERMSALTTLQVGGDNWDSFQNATLSKILSKFPYTEHLTFSWLRDKVSDEQLAAHLKGRVDLRTLSMRQCSGARDATIDTIVKMHQLSFLSLGHCHGITPKHIEKVLDLNKLTGLTASVSSRAPEPALKADHEALAEVIAVKGQHLTTLALENTQCSSDSLMRIAQQCSQLRFLNIAGSSCLDSDRDLGARMEAARSGLEVYTGPKLDPDDSKDVKVADEAKSAGGDDSATEAEGEGDADSVADVQSTGDPEETGEADSAGGADSATEAEGEGDAESVGDAQSVADAQSTGDPEEVGEADSAGGAESTGEAEEAADAESVED